MPISVMSGDRIERRSCIAEAVNASATIQVARPVSSDSVCDILCDSRLRQHLLMRLLEVIQYLHINQMLNSFISIRQRLARSLRRVLAPKIPSRFRLPHASGLFSVRKRGRRAGRNAFITDVDRKDLN